MFLLKLIFISINLAYSLTWNTVVMSGRLILCYLDMLDKLQKRICGAVSHKLAACFEHLAHGRNVASLSLFYWRITFVDAHLNSLNWIHFLIFMTGLFRILIDCMIFLSLLLDVITIYLSIVSFLAQLDFGIICLQNVFLCTMI